MDKSFQLGNMEKMLAFSKTPTPENPPPPQDPTMMDKWKGFLSFQPKSLL